MQIEGSGFTFRDPNKFWHFLQFAFLQLSLQRWWWWHQNAAKSYGKKFFMFEYYGHFILFGMHTLLASFFFLILSFVWFYKRLQLVFDIPNCDSIVKIDSRTRSFSLCQYVKNGLSYSGKETWPKLCLKRRQANPGIRPLGTNTHQLLHRIQSIRAFTNLQ